MVAQNIGQVTVTYVGNVYKLNRPRISKMLANAPEIKASFV